MRLAGLPHGPGALTKPGSKACISVGFPLRAPKLPSGLWVGGAMRTSPFRQVRTLWPPFLPSCLRTPAGTYTASPSRESRSRWTLDRLQNALSGRFFHLQLRDRTVPPRDLWEGAGEDSLEGRYFQILQQAAQNATGPEAEALCLAARISRRILEGQEVTLP